MKSNYIIIHGSFSSPFSNWIPWLHSELEKRDLQVSTPDFPTGVGFQNYENWERLLMAYLVAGVLNDDTVIFAHSIAPVFVCKFLVKNRIRIKRLVSVCGFNNYLGIDADYDTVNRSMYLDNLADVKKYCSDIVCFYSDNDPYVKFETEREFAETIANRQIMVAGGGHLNAESGYTEFPQLLEFVEE